MKSLKIVSLLFITIICSCEATDHLETTDTITKVKMLDKRYRSRIELKKTITLDESRFKIGKIYPYAFVSSQKDIYLLDQHNQIYIRYAPDGTLKNMVGIKGKGPGEFVNPSALYVDSLENTYIFDMSKFALIIHNKDNEFVQEITFDNGNPVPGSFKLHKNRRVICLFDPQGESYFKNVDLFHSLNNRFKVIKSINIDYPSVYEQFELGNYLIVKWDMNNDFIFVVFPAELKVYKYDFKGKLHSIFELKGKDYKQINQKIGRILDPAKKMKMLFSYSQTCCVYLFNSDNLFIGYFNDKISSDNSFNVADLRSFSNRSFYYEIVTTDGVQIKAEESLLPGLPLYCSPDGMVYILLNDEPGNRKIGVYEIVLEEK